MWLWLFLCSCGVVERGVEWSGVEWSGEWGVRSAEWGAGSGERGAGSGEWGVGSGEWGVGSVECGVWSVECGVWSVECCVWSVECGVLCVECGGWRVGGGWRWRWRWRWSGVECSVVVVVDDTATNPSRFAHFWPGAQALVPAMRNDIWTSKVARDRQFLTLLASKCASRHNGVHFLNISTSTSGANMWCFVHFDFEMCFAPQRRTLFEHLNFQKCSEAEVFCTFWLRSVLRAITKYTFWTSQRPKVLRGWSVLVLRSWVFWTFWRRNVFRATTACNFSSLIWPAGSAPAALASLLFDPPEPQIIGKTQCFATLLPFLAPGSSFF